MKTVKTSERSTRVSKVICEPKILGGKPIIAGTRIPVQLILDHLAEGYMPEEIILEYPMLRRADIKAATRCHNCYKSSYYWLKQCCHLLL